MALIVEDGTGKTDAESYISLADAGTYHATRGNAAWTGTDAAKEAALRKATDYMLQAYRLRWKGTRVSSTQALDWPRAYVRRDDFAYAGVGGYALVDGIYYFPSDSVPDEVARACADLALRALTADLLADQGPQVLSETVGPISVSYQPGGRQGTAYRAIDGLLAPFLKGVGQIAVARA